MSVGSTLPMMVTVGLKVASFLRSRFGPTRNATTSKRWLGELFMTDCKEIERSSQMSFLLTFVVVLATMVALAMAAVRRYFLTSDSGAYVFVALNWALLLVLTIFLTFIVKSAERFFAG